MWENNRKVIELHNEDYAKGVHDFSMEMNAFGDLVSAHGQTTERDLLSAALRKPSLLCNDFFALS